MKNINILLTRSMLAGDIDYIKNRLNKSVEGMYTFTVPEDFSEESLCALAPDADMLLGPFVSEKLIAAAGKLKLIQIPWTGVDNFNFAALGASQVPVCNTHTNADSVAEICIAIVLDLVKKISYHDRKMREGNWNRTQKPLDLFSGSMADLSACVIGFGHIGQRVARLLSAFGTKVSAVDAKAEGKDGITVYSPCEADKALADADIVILTLPLTPATRGMVNPEYIGKMKNGAILVNMSRAAICDEDAVYNALVSEQLAGYGADVWWSPPARGESESYPSDRNRFWELDQVIMSPHRAGFIKGSLPHLDGACDNIIRLIRGEELADRVDTKNCY
ncbi:MAG: hypothetical protein IJB57_00750 [Clostridia bacterium]|nr:hypothetical protein [Clostridia bacterium]